MQSNKAKPATRQGRDLCRYSSTLTPRSTGGRQILNEPYGQFINFLITLSKASNVWYNLWRSDELS